MNDCVCVLFIFSLSANSNILHWSFHNYPNFYIQFIQFERYFTQWVEKMERLFLCS